MRPTLTPFRVLLLSLLTSLLLAGLPGRADADRPATTPEPRPALYVALGDSYSSGLGVSGPLTGGECRRSAGAWPRILGSRWPATTLVLACAGARIPGVRDQIGVLRELMADQPAGRRRLVTVTVGGNDVGFSRTLRLCILQSCTSEERALRDRVDLLRPRLRRLYAAAAAAAPGAIVLAGGYPLVVEPGGRSANPLCRGIAAAERRMIGRLTTRLNNEIAVAARQAGVVPAGPRVQRYFAGHGACSRSEWVRAGTRGRGPRGRFAVGDGSFHPNPSGQQACARLFGQVFAEVLGEPVRS